MIKKIEADIVVCGAGYSGICSAVAASRHGAKVALINDRPVLGGNGSSELMVTLQGATAQGSSTSIYASEGGIIDEIQLEIARQGGRNRAVMDSVLFDLIYNEENIQLFLNTLICEVDAKDSKIMSVTGRQLASENVFVFEAPVFIDCTGDATVGFLAGAEYMYGREGKNEYNENLAPDKADDKVMGSSILFETEDTKEYQEYVKPAFACDFESEPFMKNINKPGMYRDILSVGPQWWIEYGGVCNTISDNEEIAFTLRRLVYGFWDYIKNSGKYPEAQNHKITWIAPIPGKRESRRLKGDYVLTQNDIMNKNYTNDGVAVGGWKIDIHPPGGIYDSEPATCWEFVDGNYMIPYRCLYSVNISNLLMAGRNASVTHVALGSTRVMCTCAAMGQAAGTAAYLCIKYGVEPRDIYNNYIDELKTLLKYDNQSMMNYIVPDKFTPDSVCASSQKKYEITEISESVVLSHAICLVLPIITERVHSIKIAVKNNTDKNENLSILLLNGNKIETYRPDNVIKKIEVGLEPCYDGWKELELDIAPSDGRKLYMVFEKNQNIELYMSEDSLSGVEAFNYFRPGEKEHHDFIPLDVTTGFANCERNRNSVCFKDIIPQQNIYAPQMLFNGFDRPYGLPNCWMSEDKDNQYVRFSFSPKIINEISLTFSTPMDGNYTERHPKKLIKSYEILLLNSGKAVDKIIVKNNHKRLVKHAFTNVYADEIVFVPKENYGEKYYELFQITVNGGISK